MSVGNSTSRAAQGKPAKPRPDFPLTAHPAGYWCKKIRGKLHYFGKWADPQAALDEYLRVKDALHAGREPRPDPQAITVKDVVNAFLNHKQALLDAGELSPRTFAGYRTTTDMLVERFGKTRLAADLGTDDFAKLRKALSERCGPIRLGNTIQVVRSVFKHAFDAELFDKPMRFGPGFKRPSKKVLRLDKAKKGPKLFTREEILRLLDAAGVQLKAMLLLAINAGFGNADCAHLPMSAVDLERGWIDFPRPKTGIARKCPLWPETVAAVKGALAKRPEPKKAEHAGLVFVTKYGLPWFKDDSSNPIAQETGKLLRQLNINGRTGLGFYTLRHVFRTVADETKDQVAVDFLMGHSREDMASVYRETISDERLQAVAQHVREWLFGTNAGGSTTKVEAAEEEATDAMEGHDEGNDPPTLKLYAAG